MKSDENRWEKLNLKLPVEVGDSLLFAPLKNFDFCDGKKFFYQKPRKLQDLLKIANETIPLVEKSVIDEAAKAYYAKESGKNYCDLISEGNAGGICIGTTA